MMILVRNPIGPTYTEDLRAQAFARLTVLVAVASIVAGCSAANGDGGSHTPPLQLRLVTSSAKGPCSAPPLTSDGPGSACDGAGTTTYELAESLGVVTPTSVTLDGQGTGQTVVAEFDKADASKLGDVTGKALEKQLAILLDGRVLSAPVVKEPLTGGNLSFAFETASEAEQVAAELDASATS
jgi:preprotein translocase subunit SecD